MKFESSADAELSNSSNGADAPAAAFGKTACADFASAGYKNDEEKRGGGKMWSAGRLAGEGHSGTVFRAVCGDGAPARLVSAASADVADAGQSAG